MDALEAAEAKYNEAHPEEAAGMSHVVITVQEDSR